MLMVALGLVARQGMAEGQRWTRGYKLKLVVIVLGVVALFSLVPCSIAHVTSDVFGE